MTRKERRKKAVALQYDQSKDSAPKVTASGSGYVAENILEKAKKHNVPVQEDETMVELLAQLDINEKIPEELYRAVAEVFAYIYKADKDFK